MSFGALFKKYEFIVRIAVFALTFYYTLDFIFVCEVSNLVGVSVLIVVLLSIILIHYFVGRKHQVLCPLCKK